MKHWRIYLACAAIALVLRLGFMVLEFQRDVDETGAFLALAEDKSAFSVQAENILPEWLLRSWIARRYPEQLEHYGNRVTGIEFHRLGQSVDPDSDITDKAILSRLKRHHSLRTFLISGDGVTDNLLTAIAEVPNLRDLSLEYTSLTSKSFAIIARHRRLESLTFQTTEALDASAFAALAPLGALKSLSVEAEPLTWGAGVGELAALRRLERVELKRGEIKSGPNLAFAALAECRSLKSISLPGTTHAIGPALAELAALPKLESLDLSGCTRLNRPLPADFGLRSLTALDLSNTNIGDATLETFARPGRLRRLNVSNTNITDRAMTMLRRCPDLTNLSIADTAVTDAGVAALGPLATLSVLDVTGTGLGDEALRVACRNFPLRSLKAAGTRIGDGALAELARLSDLHTLDLTATAVTDEGLKSLPAFAGIQRLSLGNNAITDAGLPSLYRYVGIRRLDLAGTDVSRKGLVALEKATTPASVSGGRCMSGSRLIISHIHPREHSLREREVCDIEPLRNGSEEARPRWNGIRQLTVEEEVDRRIRISK